MKIQAAVCRDAGGWPVIETLELEPPRSDEILVRLEACGVCHTDLRMASRPGPRPIVLGHEGAGVIVEVGDGVEGLEAGDRVLMSYGWCGHCPACLSRAKAYCRHSGALNFSGLREDGTTPLSGAGEPVFGAFFGQSAFASHAICQARCAVKAPDDLPLDLLAPLGCGVQTGAGAVLNSLALQPGQSLAVFGTGAVGLSAVMAGKVAGASRIIAVDTNAARLALALELGASVAIDPAGLDPAAAIRDATGDGVDAVLNTTDLPEVFLQGIASLAPKGRFGFVTMPRAPLNLDLAPIFLGGRTVRGVVQGDSEPDVFIPRLIGLHREGRLPLERLITTYPFEAIAEAMHDAEAGRTIKPVLRM